MLLVIASKWRPRIAVALWVMIPIVLWARTIGPLDGGHNIVLRKIAIVFALVGFTTYSQNLVLVARIRPVERFMGGLDKLYKFHERLALFTLTMLFIHGSLMAASLIGPGALEGFSLKVALGGIALGGLAGGITTTFRAPIRRETFIWVQRTLGATFGLAAVHAIVVPGALGVAPVVRTYLIAVALIGGSGYLFRSILGRITVPRRRYSVDAVNRLGPDVAELVLVPKRRRLKFQPGQFGFVTIVGGTVSREPHPYAMLTAPDDERLRFMVKALGDYTAKLQELEPGCEARVEGPYGTFWTKGSDAPRQIWIGVGVGVAPLVSMAHSLDDDRAVDLYYVTAGPEQAHFIDELFELADRNMRLRVIPIRKKSLGLINADDIKGASREIAASHIFICGPPEVMNNLANEFVAIGVPSEHIHFEDFSFM
jgi:predicted ferric reductase